MMLIDERAISQAEYTGLFFEAANGTTFVGSPTMGANGDVTTLTFPGDIVVYRPGMFGHIRESHRPTAFTPSVTVVRSGGSPQVSPPFTSAVRALYLNSWANCFRSQTLTVPSRLPETSSRLSGMNARQLTTPV